MQFRRRRGSLLLAAFLLLSRAIHAQQAGDGNFSCAQTPATYFQDPGLTLIEFNSPDKIKDWQRRPALRFQGFAEQKYGFSEVTFFRWHVPVKGREGAHEGFNRGYEDQLALAVRISGSRTDQRWFELDTQGNNSQTWELLNIQPDAGDANGGDNQPQSEDQPSDSDPSKRARLAMR